MLKRWKHFPRVTIILMFIATFVKPQKWQFDRNDVRGNSFGLENFLFHGYEEAAINEAVKNEQKTRPAGGYKSSTNDEVKIDTFKVTTRPKIISTLKNKQAINKSATDVAKGNTSIVVKPEESSSRAPIEKLRPRIVMRRRKRPYNSIQSNSKNQDSDRFISTTGRNSSENAPPSALKVRSTISPIGSGDSVKTSSFLQTSNMKPAEATPIKQSKISQEEQIQQVEITKLEEHSTSSTPKKTGSPDKAYTINLKDLLKQQTETLSLSELLQTQNLSLADLLRGNKDASVILKSKLTTTMSPTTELKQNTIYTTEPTTEAIGVTYKVKSINKKLDVQLDLENTTTFKNNYRTPMRTTTTKAPTVTQSNADFQKVRKIVKPTNKGSTFPLNVDSHNRISEFRVKLRNHQRITTTQQPEVSNSSPEKIEVPTTTPIPPVISTTKTTEIPLHKNKRIPYKSSNNPELSLIVPNKKAEVKEKQNKITDWTGTRLLHKHNQSENLIFQSLKVPTVEISTETLKVEFPYYTGIETSSQKRAEEIIAEEIKKLKIKDDLIELLESGHSADALKKIVESRNMTLEEVLNNREKSTVHSNIEELFASQQTYNPPLGNQASIYLDENLKAKDFVQLKTSTESNVYNGHSSGEIVNGKANPILNRESKQFIVPVPAVHEDPVFHFKPDDLTADTSNNENLAIWKLSEKSVVFGSTFAQGGPLSVKHYTDRPKIHRNTPEPEDDIILLETLERNQETERKRKFGIDDFLMDGSKSSGNDRSYIPPAVKSAIIASGVVMGIALFVFIAIFATCGWRQRRVRFRGPSSILNQTFTKNLENSKIKTDTLTTVKFNDAKTYNKSFEPDNDDSDSNTSFENSHLWNTFKNTLTNRANTLKCRLEREEKCREDKLTLRGNQTKKKLRHLDDIEDSSSNLFMQKELKKIDRTRQVINTSFNFKRPASKNNINYFGKCSHRY